MKSVSEYLIPNRPLPIRSINALERGVGKLGIITPKLDVKKIFTAAQKQAKTDFDISKQYTELLATLTKLCKELETKAKLNQTDR
jgi:hypothetical protein